MKKKSAIILGAVICAIICGGLVWWLLPVRLLSGVEPEEIAAIEVINGNNGDQFVIADAEGISRIVNGIRQVNFRKKEFGSNIEYWYHLTFMDGSGEKIASLGMRNTCYAQKDITGKQVLYYYCDGELDEVGSYLESLEAALFPDYKRDPDR